MSDLSKLVAQLPEVYQPIHGHPELSGQVSRPCQDRLKKIIRIHDALQGLLGRQLNVLDLGCAQGYFSLGLAERGANVHGVDYLDKNIAVCNAIIQDHQQLNASFETGLVEDAICHLEPGHYDLVLGLSVFHHIVHEKGVDEVTELLELAAKHSGALIIELALHDEPLYWAPAQPENPKAMLESIAFVCELAHHETHLSSISRPLYVASNRYWLLGDLAGQFDSWSTDPHSLSQGAHSGSRRYFFSQSYVVKQYRFDHIFGPRNRTEFDQEAQFLDHPPEGFTAPSCIVNRCFENEGWLVMERLPGRLLLDLLKEEIDHRAVLLVVLHQLAFLEAVGLYHDDVRTWNVLVSDDGTIHLIDYGSISPKEQDCVWPGNLFLSFFIFAREVATGVVDSPDPLRTISISPYGLPHPYRAWAKTLWSLPLSEWSFQLMHETLQQTPANMPDEQPLQPIEVWMKATEEAIQAQKIFINHVGRQAEAKTQEAHAKALEAETKARQAETNAQEAHAKAYEAETIARQAEAKAQEAHATAHEAEAKAMQAEAKAQEVEAQTVQAKAEVQQAETRAEQAEATLTAIYNSRLWRLTAPWRWVGNVVRRFAQGSIAWLTFAPGSRPRRFLRSVLIFIKSGISAHPLLKTVMAGLLSPFSNLDVRLRSIGNPLPAGRSKLFGSMENGLEGVEGLSPRARKIYSDLKAAIEQRHTEQR